MATIIKLKRGTSTPTTSDLANGEVGIDTSAKKFYINDSGTIKQIIGNDVPAAVLGGDVRAYTGDGSTTAFTVSTGADVDSVLVFVNGVYQRPTTDYTISGTTLTFDTAPASADAVTIKELVEGLNSINFADDSSTSTEITSGDTLTLAGGTGISSTISGDTATFAIDNTVTTNSGTQTLTNKTINSASNTITITESDISDLGSYITASSTDTLTNKTIDGSNNTISNIGNSSLTNSSITINGSSVALGGSTTISTASTLTLADDTSTTASIDLNSETLTVAGGTNITTSLSGNTLTIDGPTLTTFGVTSTSTELNLLDGVTGITLGNANELLVVGSDGSSIDSDSTLAVDTSNNRLGINQSSPEVTLHMTGEGAQTAQIRMEQYNDTSDAPDLRTRRYRGTIASPSAVQSGDYLYRSNHEYYNGTSLVTGGSLAFDNTNNAARTEFKIAVDTDGTGSDILNGEQFKIDGNDSGAITFNDAYKFPTSDGSANQVLQTDGSGNLSFATVSSGGNAFSTINLNDSTNVVADSSTDTLNLDSSGLISITGDASTDTVTVSTVTSATVPFLKADGSSSDIDLQTQGSLGDVITNLYIPFTIADGSAQTSLVVGSS